MILWIVGAAVVFDMVRARSLDPYEKGSLRLKKR